MVNNRNDVNALNEKYSELENRKENYKVKYRQAA